MVGAGGIHAEILRDTACRLAPFDEDMARAMIDELRCRPIRDGVRGKPALDVGAAAAALAALSRFAWRHREHVREIDINPLFVLSDEKTNRLHMFRHGDDALEAMPAFTRDSLANPRDVVPRQLAGPIHLHPNGRLVHLANRADHSIEHNGRTVFAGGENSIAVFALDPETGEPRLLQHAATRSYHVRTFAIDPSRRLLVAASIKALAERDGDRLHSVPAALSLFRIAADGTLDLLRRHDIETPEGRLQYWMGMVAPG